MRWNKRIRKEEKKRLVVVGKDKSVRKNDQLAFRKTAVTVVTLGIRNTANPNPLYNLTLAHNRQDNLSLQKLKEKPGCL